MSALRLGADDNVDFGSSRATTPARLHAMRMPHGDGQLSRLTRPLIPTAPDPQPDPVLQRATAGRSEAEERGGKRRVRDRAIWICRSQLPPRVTGASEAGVPLSVSRFAMSVSISTPALVTRRWTWWSTR